MFLTIQKERLTKKLHVLESVNPLPDDKILDWSKLKQVADDI